MHNTRRLIQGSFLGALIDFEPTHELHTEFGCVVLFGALLLGAGWIVNLSVAGQGKFVYMSTVMAATAFHCLHSIVRACALAEQRCILE
jgi:hypothetical protein